MRRISTALCGRSHRRGLLLGGGLEEVNVFAIGSGVKSSQRFEFVGFVLSFTFFSLGYKLQQLSALVLS